MNTSRWICWAFLILSIAVCNSEEEELEIDRPEPGVSLVELARYGGVGHPEDLASDRETVFLWSSGTRVTCIKKVGEKFVCVLRDYDDDLRSRVSEEFVWPLEEKEARPFLDLWLGWLRDPVYQDLKFEPGRDWKFAVMDGLEVFEGRIRRYRDDQNRFSDLMANLVGDIAIVSKLNYLSSGEPEALKKLPGSPSLKEIEEDYVKKRQEVQSTMGRLQALLVRPKPKN